MKKLKLGILVIIFLLTVLLFFVYFKSSEIVGKVKIYNNLGVTNVIKYPVFKNKKLNNQINRIIYDLNKDNVKFINNTDFKNISVYHYIDYDLYISKNNIGIVFYDIVKNDNLEKYNEKAYAYNFNAHTGEVQKIDEYLNMSYHSKIKKYIKHFFINNNIVYNKNINDYTYIINDNGLKIYMNNIHGNQSIPYVINIPYNKIDIFNRYITNCKVYKTKRYSYIKKDIDFNGAILKKKSRVRILEVINKDIVKIKFNHHIEYINPNLLTDNLLDFIDLKEKNKIMYTNNKTTLYIKPNNRIIDNITYSKKVRVIGEKNNYYQILYKNKIGYVKKAKLNSTNKNQNYRKIDKSKPMVALTFDDGPNPVSTPRIINTLKQYNSVATFFDLGILINKIPSVVQDEEKYGNEVESHTFDHANLNKLNEEEINREIIESEKVFEKVLHHKPSLVRPPYGNANEKVKQTIKYPLVNWTIDTLDWESRDKDEILKQFRKKSNYDGQIILMHSIYGSTADAVEVMVPELINKGYQLVTVSELFYYKGIDLKDGNLYY